MKPISDHYRRQCWLLARDCALASAIRMNLKVPALYAPLFGCLVRRLSERSFVTRGVSQWQISILQPRMYARC
jgi:hypothetical protein